MSKSKPGIRCIHEFGVGGRECEVVGGECRVVGGELEVFGVGVEGWVEQ